MNDIGARIFRTGAGTVHLYLELPKPMLHIGWLVGGDGDLLYLSRPVVYNSTYWGLGVAC